jgi:flagellar protein FlgJ
MDMTILHGHDAGAAPSSPTHSMDGFFHQSGGQQAPQEQESEDLTATGQSFTDKLTIPAMLASQQSGIPHHLILAQAALESDWGRREIPASNGKPSYNLFGIKATGDWHGKTANVMTTEYQDGQSVKVMQRFRVYGSYLEGIKDYIHVLTDNPRYHEVVNASEPEAAAYALQRAGYATDPYYGAKPPPVMRPAPILATWANCFSAVQRRRAWRAAGRPGFFSLPLKFSLARTIYKERVKIFAAVDQASNNPGIKEKR